MRVTQFAISAKVARISARFANITQITGPSFLALAFGTATVSTAGVPGSAVLTFLRKIAMIALVAAPIR